MAANDIICPMCGFKNAANAARCSACGAKLEVLGAGDLTDEELQAKRYQQEGFEWKWAFIAFGVYMTLQGVFLVLLDLVIEQYDPQGSWGILISVAVWFVGGVAVGFVSPGRTFLEPAVGALLAVVPTVIYLVYIDEVYDLSLLVYIVGGLIGVMVTLVGAFLGERLQLGARGGQAT